MGMDGGVGMDGGAGTDGCGWDPAVGWSCSPLAAAAPRATRFFALTFVRTGHPSAEAIVRVRELEVRHLRTIVRLDLQR